MDRDLRDVLAMYLLGAWLMMLGLQPNKESEEIRDYGPHRVYLLSAMVNDGSKLDVDQLSKSLEQFLSCLNQLGFCRYQPYNVELYPHTWGGTLYVSMFQ